MQLFGFIAIVLTLLVACVGVGFAHVDWQRPSGRDGDGRILRSAAMKLGLRDGLIGDDTIAAMMEMATTTTTIINPNADAPQSVSSGSASSSSSSSSSSAAAVAAAAVLAASTPDSTATPAAAKNPFKKGGRGGKKGVGSSGKSAAEMEALFKTGDGHPAQSAVRRMNLQKIRNSVVQIVCAHSGFNWKAPWQSGSEQEVSGTGFFVVIDGQSYILTNAHVVKEAIKVRVRVPDVGLDNFGADVFGICFEKDIALLKMRAEDTENLRAIRRRNGGDIEHLELGDSDHFAQGSIAIAVGYPLGQANLKFSTGILSGFEHVTERLYLQITAPINPGNSGGPLLANNGLVMGVNTAAYEKASNVGYAIPSSHIKALLNNFVKTGSHLVSPVNGGGKESDDKESVNRLEMSAAVIQTFPYLGVGLAPATKELCRFLKYRGDGGVFVRKVAPKGIANDAGLKPRDLLLEFDGHKLDRFGKTMVSAKKGAFAERMTIYDLAERVEIGKRITFRVWRDGSSKELNAVFEHKPEHEYAVRKIVEPVRQSVSYIVIGGVVFMDLYLNHIELLVEHNPTLINYFRGKHRLKPRVVVSGVLPECTLPEDSINPGELITNVNGKPVNTLTDLQALLDSALKTAEADTDHTEKSWLTIETSENSMVVFDLSKVETRHGTASHELGKLVGNKRRHHRRRRRGGKGRGGKGHILPPKKKLH